LFNAVAWATKTAAASIFMASTFKPESNPMDIIDLEKKSSAKAAGPLSKLTCLFSFAGLTLLLYIALYRPIYVPPDQMLSPWWMRGFLMAGSFLVLGLCCCASSLWRKETDTLFKTFGLFLNFVVMFLVGVAVASLWYPEYLV
jgi:hypothetical protein